MNITDTMKAVATAMGIHFMSGTRMEINKRLTKKRDRYDKYPLLVLYVPIQAPARAGMLHCKLNMAILEFTNRVMNAEERNVEVFKPTLIPLYRQFLFELSNTGEFIWEGDMEYPPHTHTMIPFFGNESKEGMIKMIYTDPLDAIAINDLNINKVIECEEDLFEPTLPVEPEPEEPGDTPGEGDILQFIDGSWVYVSQSEFANKILNTPTS
jgi:hypothetical protein